jgi:ketosteroid isomerase-like protein
MITVTLSILISCQSRVQLASVKQSEKEPRTVFGELPKPEGERRRATNDRRDTATANQESKQESKQVTDRESPRETVTRILYRWAQTSTSRDLNRHISLYARNLDRFYDGTNVRREAVRRQKQRTLKSSTPYNGQQIRDLSLRVQDDGRLVIAEFEREVIRAGIGKESVHQRLVWKRLADGDWKIIREEAL